MKHLLVSILLIHMIVSCKSELVVLPEIINKVSFSDLEDGQYSTYIRYQSNCALDQSSFSYTGDTLILEVVKVDEAFTLRESVTAGSPLFANGQFVEPISYSIAVENSIALIPNRSASALFFFYGNDELQLQPNHDVELSQDNCRLMSDEGPFIGIDIGHIQQLSFADINISDKTAVSCVPIIIDLDAYLIYDADQLYLSHSISWDGEAVFGWWLLD